MAEEARLETMFKRHSGPVTITGPDLAGVERTVTVVVVKLNPVQKSKAEARAQAARARATASRNQNDSVEFLQALDEIIILYGDDRRLLVQAVASVDLGEQFESIKARIKAEPEWAEHGYLQGLNDSLTDEVAMRAAMAAVYKSGGGAPPDFNPDVPEVVEAVHIVAEIDRWRTQVAGEFERYVDDHMENYAHLSLEELRERAARDQMTTRGELAAREELIRCQIWLGTRFFRPLPDTQSPEHPEGLPDLKAPLYFESREQVDEVEDPVRITLARAVEKAEVGSLEGNGSPAPAGSSTSSEPPSDSATDPSSSLTAATV